MIDGTAALIQPILQLRSTGEWNDDRSNNLIDGGSPYYRTYECRDGRFIAVGAVESQFYAELLRMLGIDAGELGEQNDRERWPETIERIAAVFATKSRDEWSEIFTGFDACATPVLSFDEAPHHPHVVARRALLESPEGTVAGPAPRFSRTSDEWSTAPAGSIIELDQALDRWRCG
jgi:alpha-methylacyl-CoA racemase